MGYGDELMGSGIARDARLRGYRVAFGDGRRVIWGREAFEVYQGNPNVVRPGEENFADPLPIRWVAHYRGCRLYGVPGPGRWIWNDNFRPIPGQVFFSESERLFANSIQNVDVIVEPATKNKPNKQWPVDRYRALARLLALRGYRVAQLTRAPTDAVIAPEVHAIAAPTFRLALAALTRTRLFVGPEGGLHHGAAALGVQAVVIFGGFIHPNVTGYPSHRNLFTGGKACGTMNECQHCRDAMDRITLDDVMRATMDCLE